MAVPPFFCQLRHALTRRLRCLYEFRNDIFSQDVLSKFSLFWERFFELDLTRETLEKKEVREFALYSDETVSS